MEQRSQILKQMHLTKNEREREVRWPWLGSQSLKLLPALGLHKSGMAQGWHASPRALLITLIPPITHCSCTYQAIQPRCRGLWHGCQT